MGFEARELLAFHPTVILAIGVVLLSIYMFKRANKNLPPGPMSLPVLGTVWAHSPFLKMEDLLKLSEKYGDIYRLNINGMTLVILNSYDVINEAAIKKPLEFANRNTQDRFMFRSISPKGGGIIMRDFDNNMRQVRSTSLSIMRDLGVGRSAMADIITEQALELSAALASTNGEGFYPCDKVSASVANVILHVMLNKKYDYSDKELLGLIEAAGTFVKKLVFAPIFDRFPSLRFVPPLKKHFDAFVRSNEILVEYMWTNSKPFISAFQPGDNSHFVNTFIYKKYDAKHDKLDIDENELKYLLRDFLLAGIETTTTSLKWSILLLANNPEIQSKLHAELDSVVGRDRAYRLEDKLPYLDAFIWEVQRYSSIAPRTTHAPSNGNNPQLAGYDIPKDAFVIFNLFSVHQSKETWGDPQTFRPERFLNENGKFVKHSHVIPFSLGKRSCLGELLARQELYIFTAILLQRFEFLPPEGVETIDYTLEMAGTRVPKPFLIRAIPRS